MKFINIKDQKQEILEQIRNELDRGTEKGIYVPCEQNPITGEWIWCPKIVIKDEVKAIRVNSEGFPHEVRKQ